MRGSQIIVDSYPKGVFKEGTIQGSNLYPGIACSIVLGVSADGSGNLTYQPLTTNALGDPRLTLILLNDDNQGFLYNIPYVSGTRAKFYCPLPGEDMNVCVSAQTGTGSLDAYTVGERLVANNATGQFQVQATSANPSQFTSNEHVDIPADAVGWVWATKS